MLICEYTPLIYIKRKQYNAHVALAYLLAAFSFTNCFVCAP